MSIKDNPGSGLVKYGWFLTFLGIVFIIWGSRLFDTETYIWVRDTGYIGTLNIEQSLFFAITGSSFILSGSLLIGIQSIGKKYSSPSTLFFAWILFFFGIGFMIQGYAMFDTRTYLYPRTNELTIINNIEQTLFYAITGGAFILSSSLLFGLDYLGQYLRNRS